MRTTGIVAALLLAVSLFTPGQGWGDELSESYFPLKEGMRWEYNVISDQGATKKLLITNLAPREVKRHQSDAPEMGVGRSDFYRVNETG